jgi:hypothetical protein
VFRIEHLLGQIAKECGWEYAVDFYNPDYLIFQRSVGHNVTALSFIKVNEHSVTVLGDTGRIFDLHHPDSIEEIRSVFYFGTRRAEHG